ncbi:hypothetical protein BVY11_25595 [Pseudomonas amygdali pv. morsprunorum]|uniref:hypothetical protein n=1 Tax=Pseudomonas syringae group TaxID=136849 RepID=UPI00070F1293|nr:MULTISPECIES: hypothetical protein [Pseudomonas syringae group]MBI6730105.1 hypothetical protein [Pseudomonas amygdali]KWS91579.1 hypothetical protein AL049_21470 [Pseudomonas syringae pv. cerasicola]MBI6814779.1 hypothetical protein [Pseudomonas amygdali]PHN78246.1 hypothetical protein AO272_22090 [Pseudomonas syringae pv. cerasicola]PHN79448.1 hypothetical protein AO252_13645 [Pseudomonas syringae pv. cerasicola]
MPKPSTRAPIPQIEMIKKGGQWEVHWDYQEGPASLVLFNRAEYLRGYIDGVLDMLRIAPERVCCASGVTGTVKRLYQKQAEALHSALSQLLIPMVEAEFARIARNTDLPHLRSSDAIECNLGNVADTTAAQAPLSL